MTRISTERLAHLRISPTDIGKNEILALVDELTLRRRTAASDLVGDVRAFNVKFSLPYAPAQKPRFLPDWLMQYRRKFHAEETQELEDAIAEGNMADAADALVDRVYVDIGTAHFMGIPFGAHWREVQRANMAKELASGPDDPRIKARSADIPKDQRTIDVCKPADWRAPDHDRVLRDHMYIYHDATVP